MLDADLAALYHVPTRVLVQAVKRNLARFPGDFMFQLRGEEARRLRSRIVISNVGRGGRRYPPYAFTEQGVSMLSSVLRSPRAIRVNIEIMRAFVRLRGLLASNQVLAKKVDALEKKYDSQFKVVFDAIRRLMASPITGRHPIGFRPQRVPHRLQQLLPRERLLEHAPLVEIERAAGGLRDRAGGDEEKAALEDRHAAHRLPVEGQAVHAREVEIADDHLDFPVQLPERFLRRRCAPRPVALLLEAAAKNLPQ